MTSYNSLLVIKDSLSGMGFRVIAHTRYDESSMEYIIGLIVDGVTSIWATSHDEQIAVNELYQKATILREQLLYWQSKSK